MNMKEKPIATVPPAERRRKRTPVNVALVGGMERLRRHYHDEAEKFGINLRVFNMTEVNIVEKLQNHDAVVIFTNRISHLARREVMIAAKSGQMEVLMIHSCGICAWRDCIGCLMKNS